MRQRLTAELIGSLEVLEMLGGGVAREIKLWRGSCRLGGIIAVLRRIDCSPILVMFSVRDIRIGCQLIGMASEEASFSSQGAEAGGAGLDWVKSKPHLRHFSSRVRC